MLEDIAKRRRKPLYLFKYFVFGSYIENYLHSKKVVIWVLRSNYYILSLFKLAIFEFQSWWRGMKVRKIYRVPFLQKRVQRFETLLREKSNIIMKLQNQFYNLECGIETIIAENKRQALKIAEMQQCLTVGSKIPI